MKKYFPAFAAILFSLITLLSCSKKDENPSGPAEQNPPASGSTQQKKWTFLLYDDADFFMAYDPIYDFSSLVSSNSDINYIVMRDGEKTDASYYQIDENHKLVALQGLGEVNMGAQSTLEKFISFAKTHFPADRYILAFYDHGGGWMGTCSDLTSNDNLTPKEIADALSKSGGADLVLFTAPCLMGSIESAYQLRKSAQYYIGSEDLSGFIYWIGMLKMFDSYLKNNEDVSNYELSKEIISMHDEKKYVYGYGSQITMSAVELSKISTVVQSFNTVTNYYMQNPSKFKSIQRSKIKTYYVDFCDFEGVLESLLNNETESSARAQIQNTINLFKDCVVSECHGDSTIGSNGLNIYFPLKLRASELYYIPGIGLDFKSDCSWNNLMCSYLSKSAAGDNPLDNIFKSRGRFPY